MKLTKYEVRWDEREEEPFDPFHHETPYDVEMITTSRKLAFVAVKATDAFDKAYTKLCRLRMDRDSITSVLNVKIENLRLVKVTEEVVA